MDWVGHEDMKTTMVIYVEINKDKNMEEYEKMNKIFK